MFFGFGMVGLLCVKWKWVDRLCLWRIVEVGDLGKRFEMREVEIVV